MLHHCRRFPIPWSWFRTLGVTRVSRLELWVSNFFLGQLLSHFENTCMGSSKLPQIFPRAYEAYHRLETHLTSKPENSDISRCCSYARPFSVKAFTCNRLPNRQGLNHGRSFKLPQVVHFKRFGPEFEVNEFIPATGSAYHYLS